MAAAEGGHLPVMLSEVLEALAIRPEGIYVDCTFGRGGHSRAILERLGAEGRLLAIDRDLEAVAAAGASGLPGDARFAIEHGRFSEIGRIVGERGWTGRVDGILMDLGVSSPQLDDARRGFSFLRAGPLDMRMDPSQKTSAAEWLAEVSERELTRVLREYGEERFAGRIARAVAEERQRRPIATTTDLVRLIEAAIPFADKFKHPATRTFQAIRIAVNDELGELQQGLNEAVEALAAGGRLVVISFHSLEDRIVKRFMRDEARGKEMSGGIFASRSTPRLAVRGKPLKANEDEVRGNPRARSAMLRVAEKRAP
ncbi:16S rRNA (cytosine(1402)-N(4))-methyltransferase RsmH [Methylococcus sp. Mc7]|uniref:16S rRNA (cytosine(1402)-N(4))-methyltransferase RsmH n=1 Tax=Methylococcus sp. Mc7 TaxID=2860258 RepID=UPI002107C8DE|nr:16S rRNA (cytosine(1402)-N(4))-methyltransferase RsmH [Methylococcus sp. Mc7]